MRVLACVLAGLACSSAPGHASACPHDASLGAVSFPRGGKTHVVSLGSCVDRVVGVARPATRAVPGVTTSRARAATQRIWVRGRLVFAQRENGPVIPLRLSTDGRWLFFVVDAYGSSSIAADGLDLLVVSTRSGPVHHLGSVLVHPDYLTWCGGELVYAAGGDRIAIHGKRLLVAAPPSWRPRALWNDPERTFASPSCEPGHNAVAVLSQRSSIDARFFATRWRLWRVGLDGTRHVVDVPPPGWADEEPTWSPDGRSLAFVCERNGYGRIMLLRDRRLIGPIAPLGYSLGYYGHHDWGIEWRR
ncbi:MAG: TolB family protein [Gaiellaceae bacterium]